MEKYKIPTEVLEFFKEHASHVKTGGKDYFFFHVWIEDAGDGLVFMHHLGRLPDELKSAIEGFREGGFNPKLSTE